MNIFCHAKVLSSDRLRGLLGIESGAAPQFGFKPRTPLKSGRYDNTESDMEIDQILVEAKLTKTDFQPARFALLSRYRDFEAVFDPSELPQRNEVYCGYQLIRGTLAAYADSSSFCVLFDARRSDLIESWFRIIGAVRPFDLRYRLKLLTCTRFLRRCRMICRSFWRLNMASIMANLCDQGGK
jgi:hypothetical protein